MNIATAFDYSKSSFGSNCRLISDFYAPQTNGEISASIMQNWTQQAIECYEIQCDCSKCSLANGGYSFVCQMPKIVKALLKTYGKPEKSLKFFNEES